jgi:hypothetical protein
MFEPIELKMKSRRDDLMIAQGKRSAALGFRFEMISSFFLSGLARARQTRKKKGGLDWGRITQGGGLGGLALGYFHAALPGLRTTNKLAAGTGNDGIASGFTIGCCRSGVGVPARHPAYHNNEKVTRIKD